MLNLLPPQSMYPPSGVHFRNPFNQPSRPQSHHHYDLDLTSPSSGYSKSSVSLHRPLTPPPEMNSVASHVQRPQYPYYGERPASSVKYEPGQAKYESGAYSQPQSYHDQPKREIISQPVSKAQSPVFTENPNTGAIQKNSQMSTIAPSLQIPRSVNNSQGSLAELAAQVRNKISL